MTEDGLISCAACGLEYRLNRPVPPRGARYRCRCGETILVPGTPPPAQAAAKAPEAPALPPKASPKPAPGPPEGFALENEDEIPTVEDPPKPPAPEPPAPEPPAPKNERRRGLPLLRGLVRASLALTLLGLLSAAAVLIYFGQNLPPLDTLRDYQPARVTEVFSSDGQQIGAYFEEQRYVVTPGDLPDYVSLAFVAAEDGEFYQHGGVDPVALFRAVVVNVLQGRKAQGASTITQQVARTFLLDRKKKYSRKIREMILAWRIEKSMSKDQILGLYINQIFLGHGAYGVEAAARLYFGKHAKDLSIGEAAMIAGLPQAPSRTSPNVNYEAAIARQAYVLGRMEAEGFISSEEAKEGSKATLHFVRKEDLNTTKAPYFNEHIRRRLLEQFGHELVYRGGLQVETTVDLGLQQTAQLAVRNGAHRVTDLKGWAGPTGHLDDPTSEEAQSYLQGIDRSRTNTLRPYHPAHKPYTEGAVPSEELPPLQAQEVADALVMEVSKSSALLSVGSLHATLRVKDHHWAFRPNPRYYWRYRNLDDLTDTLTVGDTVRVRVLSPAMDEVVSGEGEEGSPSSPAYARLWQDSEIQAALLSVRIPDGAVLAMVGGTDYRESEFNRITQAKLQAGSIFKPLVYAAAFSHPRKVYTPSTIVLDSPIVGEYMKDGERTLWKPRNAGDEFLGPTPLRRGLILSRNLITLKIIHDIGVDYTWEFVQRFGFTSPISRDPTMALGSSSVTPLEIVRAYTTFATLGKRVEPYFVSKVSAPDGRVLADQSEQPATERVLKEDMTFVLVSLLQDVIRRGTGRAALVLGEGPAGKTGTTNNYADAWFTGFTPQLVTTAWVGRDDHKSLGAGMVGGRTALPIWVDYMREALKQYPERNWKMPPGVVILDVDAKTGLLARGNDEDSSSAVKVAFRKGNEPTTVSPEVGTVTAVQDLFSLDGGL